MKPNFKGIEMNHNNIHYNIFHQNSPFAKTSASALLLGIGGTVSIVTDLIWLLCDMHHGLRDYHFFIVAGLVISLIIVVAGFILFYRGISVYNHKQEIRCTTTKERLAELELRISQLELEVTKNEEI